ncbi:putative palmitoyltransferase ZDHHC19 [Sciurus carolinensis]|uniref:Palmitoyltransferase ZDHHC19 n=1 Tax=Sciurus carolinensis TaxID=30640 RepID=A0AA41T8E8_SCICA|nr:putative palmitoyltransferase ZDHHC19 [Sciurus carolinensis]
MSGPSRLIHSQSEEAVLKPKVLADRAKRVPRSVSPTSGEPGFMGSSGLLQTRSESGSGFRCRWIMENWEWAFALVTGILFLMTLWSLVFLNISDPSILHPGSFEQIPRTAYTAWMFSRAFPMSWCPMCSLTTHPGPSSVPLVISVWRYMSDAVCLQRKEGTEWEPTEALQSPRYTPAHHRTDLPAPNSQTRVFNTGGQGPPGSGETAVI